MKSGFFLVFSFVLSAFVWTGASGQDVAQLPKLPARVEVVVGNYHSSAPVVGFGGLFYKTLHPGIQLGYEKAFLQQGRRTWLWRARGGFFYHRFIQTGIPIVGEAVFQWRQGKASSSRLGIEAALGAGYMHSFPLTKTFKLQDDGTYRQVFRYGRPQGTLTVSLGASYNLDAAERYRLILRYQIALQTPFIKSYVPLLPYNILQVGLSYGLAKAQVSSPPTSNP